jgi:site-specific DNA-methyltransferase (adenine-specific)
VGFEISKDAFEHHLPELEQITPGSRLATLRQPIGKQPGRKNQKWTAEEIASLLKSYQELQAKGVNKKTAIPLLQEQYERGYFSILNVLDKHLIE